jgi:hypothetical protein
MNQMQLFELNPIRDLLLNLRLATLHCKYVPGLKELRRTSCTTSQQAANIVAKSSQHHLVEMMSRKRSHNIECLLG